MKHLGAWLATVLLISTAFADEEAANRAHVRASIYGGHYAKSIPAGPHGSRGVTRVYIVREGQDELADTYDWYAPDLTVGQTGKGVFVVRIGAWPRGQQANAGTMALAFYMNGKLLREYSTLDLAGEASNVKATRSHYRVIERIKGQRWVEENTHAFDVELVDGRTLSFDLDTGDMMKSEKR